ncbi:MAG: flagellar basal body-associated FliL family protein [Melioribacteraceae bacterium]|nr:flagellar basal body-associated FliL family protein [Melioribacteraceae bacterium]
MADEVEEVKVEKKSSPITKIILFGVPAFIVQLILVYFITANILMNKVSNSANNGLGEDVTTEESEDGNSKEDGGQSSSGQFIYTIDEVIVNPANTNGRQLLLTTLAFDLASEANKTELEGKDFLVKDMVISVLSGKTTRFLGDISLRDSLRNEIAHKVEGFLPDIKINKVYFSKFILQ